MSTTRYYILVNFIGLVIDFSCPSECLAFRSCLTVSGYSVLIFAIFHVILFWSHLILTAANLYWCLIFGLSTRIGRAPNTENEIAEYQRKGNSKCGLYFHDIFLSTCQSDWDIRWSSSFWALVTITPSHGFHVGSSQNHWTLWAWIISSCCD